MHTNFKITGRIITKTIKKAIPDLIIEAWDKDSLIHDYLGRATSNKNGEFVIEFDTSRFKDTYRDTHPDVYFMVYKQEKLIYSTKDNVIVNAASEENLTLYIPDQLVEDTGEQTDIESTSIFTITGKTLSESKLVLSQKSLVAYDVYLRGAAIYRTVKTLDEIHKYGGFEFLANGTSNRKGQYKLAFEKAQFENAERIAADVVVYMVEQNEIIGRSELAKASDYSDGTFLRDFNVVVTRDINTKTEYELLMPDLMLFLKESQVGLIALSESEDQIKFTADELEVKGALIHSASMAEALRVELETSIEKTHELFYAIGRQNIALNWMSLYSKSSDDLKNAIAKSITSFIIGFISEADADVFVELIKQKAVEASLEYTSEGQNLSLNKILSYSLPEQVQRLAFTTLAKEHKGSWKTFWTETLPKTPEFKDNPELIDKLILTQQLTLISSNHQPLVEALQTELNVSSATEALNISTEHWEGIITKTGIPDTITGDDDIQRKEKFIKQIQNTLYAAFPTEKIKLMVEEKELDVPDNVQSDLTTFLSSSNFNIASSRIYDFEEELEQISPKNCKEVRSTIMDLQRLFQVSTTSEAMVQLKDLGFKSAFSIANTPKKSFIKKCGNKLIDAEAVYQRASHITARTQQVALTLNDTLNGLAPGMVVSDIEKKRIKNTIENVIPNYTELFGSPDICECEQCSSVYSAAAYFVDLLQFITNSGIDVFNKLEKRRPDLMHIPLTCENTNTIIPYIDLVNEVLEYYVAHGNLDGDAAYDTGEATKDELRAEPGNFNIDAYEIVNNAVFPFTLPYNQPLDVIRTYIGHLQTSRYEVMKAVRNDEEDATTRAIESEFLELSPSEYTIWAKENFSGDADTTNIEDYFGVSGIESVSNVLDFLAISGIEYTDLIELIKTKFINPYQAELAYLDDIFTNSEIDSKTIYDVMEDIAAGGAVSAEIITVLVEKNISETNFIDWVNENFEGFKDVITLYEPESKCDLDTTVLRTLSNVYSGDIASGISNERWSIIHRFIRLWKKLGWEIKEVDLMLEALGATDISSDIISKLSKMVQLNESLKLNINKLSTLWGNIDTYGEKSLYEKLFLNTAIRLLDSSFEADKLGNYLSDSTIILGEHVPAILASFRITEEDFNTILEHATLVEGGEERTLDLSADILSLENLSIIYPYTVLAKALGTSIKDTCTYISMFSLSPFSSWDVDSQQYSNISPENTYNCYELISNIKKLGFKAETLQYIIDGTLEADSKIGLDNSKIKDTVEAIRSSINTIEQEHPDEPEELITIDILRSKLSLTFQTEAVDEFIAIIEDTVEYSTISEDNLDIEIPEELAEKYKYSKGSGRITCIGVMTDDEKTQLKSMDGITSTIEDSIDELYVKPEEYIINNFSGLFPDDDSDLSENIPLLLNHPDQGDFIITTKGKVELIYQTYLPLLKGKLREDALTQHIADLIGLSETATSLLIDQNLETLLVNLSEIGHSATYYSDDAFLSEDFQRSDSKINFEWENEEDISATPFSICWETYVSPPASDDYILIVEVKDDAETFELYVDDELVLGRVTGDNLSLETDLISLNASDMHYLQLNYVNGATEGGGISLYWKTATSAMELIPVSSCYPVIFVDEFIIDVNTYHRATKYINGFELTDIELAHFIDYSTNFDEIDFFEITADHWLRTSEFVVLRDAVPQAQATLIDVFIEVDTYESGTEISNTNIIELINEATAWDITTIEYLTNSYFEFSIDDFKNEEALVKMLKIASLVSKTGASAQTLTVWGKAQTDFSELDNIAQLVKSTVQAKYEEADWLEVSASLSDIIREHQQESLVNYILTLDEIKEEVSDADGLFEYFLIDVQMTSKMETSRIVQANASVQMFINRCMLNLEKIQFTSEESEVVSSGAIDENRWEWMKNYRVWEANRKVFLYPENWLEPDWRNDKSSFFTALESELTQNDITEGNVATAFRNYLTKLNQVSNLDVCGVYQDDSEGILHVFGRTHNAPYKYFYRTWNKYMKWSAWEEVPMDIRSVEEGDDSGVHLVPIVWKNRTFLFWPEFTLKQAESSQNRTDLIDVFGKSTDEIKPTQYWEMRLAWSEYSDDTWTPKQLSKIFIVPTSGNYYESVKDYTLRTSIDEEDETLIVSLRNENDYKVGYFKLIDIDASMSKSNMTAKVLHSKELDYDNLFMKHQRSDTLTLINNTYLKKSINHNLIYSNHITDFTNNINYPFFYSGNNKSYFVRPVDIKVMEYINNAKDNDPIILGVLKSDFLTQNNIEIFDEDIKDNFYDPLENVMWPSEDFIRNNYINDVVLMKTKVAKQAVSIKSISSEDFVENNDQALLSIDNQSDTKINIGVAFGGNLEYANNLKDTFWTLKDDIGLEFHSFYHPYASKYTTFLNKEGLDGLMASDTDNVNFANDEGDTFTTNFDPNLTYVPLPDDFKDRTYYKENVCFDVYGANNLYNWELFYHAPLYIANRLSKNGKYQEALKWFHYIFNPATDEEGSDTSRYWQVLPFKTTTDEGLESWFKKLTKGELEKGDEQIDEWRNSPFDPHLVASNRPIAYMKHVVMKYVDNLISWGDSLFRQDTMESVNEAIQIYVLANHILGPAPEYVPKRGKIDAETYDSLKENLDSFSNALVELENVFPYSSGVYSESTEFGGFLSYGQSLYFCIPNNDKLLTYWETVADRLYKIRHCQNINGVERSLSLFAPPIDPAMLIAATSQGLNLGSVLSDLSSPPPIYRFNYLIQKASEFCNEVKVLGSTLLSVLEKKDGEELGRMRASHETTMLDLMTSIKEHQLLEAKANRSSIEKSRESAQFRLEHYTALIDNDSVEVPSLPELSGEINADSSLPADTTIATIESDIEDTVVETEESSVKIIQREKDELDSINTARDWQMAAQASELLAGIAYIIPTADIDAKPLGVGTGASWGGTQLGNALSAAGKAFDFVSGFSSHKAILAAKMAGYIRREQDWTLQANLAAKEIIQLDKQYTAADIRVKMAEKDIDIHLKQIQHTEEVEIYLKDKFTNKELYIWMKEQLLTVFKQSYNMAFAMAKKAEKCYQYEIGNQSKSFIQYGYWNSAYQGLTSGEKLNLALRQLEKSYLEENTREFELRKHVSISILDPLAIIQLRETGSCNVFIPEAMFDLDFKGHYFRRIKSVSLSIPCITGPYTTINCTLRLLKNYVRYSTSLNDKGLYEHNHDEGVWIDDTRFRSVNVPSSSIATSSGQNDAGVFELNFRDERYLPFEGGGAISEWQIELATNEDLRQFNYSTISDVIIHLNYTAREYGGTFAEGVQDYLTDRFLPNIDGLSSQPFMQMFNMKREYSSEWYSFEHPTGDENELIVTLSKERFIYLAQNRDINIKQVDILVKVANETTHYLTVSTDYGGEDPIESDEIILVASETYNGLYKTTIEGTSGAISIENFNVDQTLCIKVAKTPEDYNLIAGDIEDIYVVISYNLSDLV